MQKKKQIHQCIISKKLEIKLVRILDFEVRWDQDMYVWLGKKYLQDLNEVI